MNDNFGTEYYVQEVNFFQFHTIVFYLKIQMAIKLQFNIKTQFQKV